MKRRHFFWYSLLFLSSCATTKIQSEGTSSGLANNLPTKLSLAITDVKGIENLQRDFGAFREALERVLETKIEFFPVENHIAAAPALLSNQIDLALAGPSEYVILQARAKVVPIIALERPSYYTVIRVRADSGIESLEQLKGKTIGMRTEGATASHLGSTKLLIDAGLDPKSDFKTLMVQDRGLQALKNGEIDAWGDSKSRHQKFFKETGWSEREFPIVTQGSPLPNDVFVAKFNLEPAILDEIRSRMLQNKDELVAAILASPSNFKYQESKFLGAKDSDYDMIRQVYKAIGQDKAIQ